MEPQRAYGTEGGILIDQDEVVRQRPIYERSIQACRELIWRVLKIRWPLETPHNLLRVLRHLGFGGLLDFDPFAAHPLAGDDQSTFTSSQGMKNCAASVATAR